MKSAAVILLAVSASVQAPAPQPAPLGAIDAVVLDAETGAPLEGVRVRLEGPDFTNVTDRDGRFAFEGLSPGSLILHAEKPGYVPARPEGLRLPGASGVPLRIAPGQVLRVELRLNSAGLVRGQVLDPRGRPMAGAVVTAFRISFDREGRSVPLTAARTRTNDLGAFVFTDIAPGDWGFRVEWAVQALPSPGVGVRASDTGMAALYYPGATRREEAGIYEVVGARETSVGVLASRVPEGGALRVGVETVPDGEPSVVASVQVREIGGSHYRFGQMPIDGEAVLGPLPPGRYSIQLADSLGRVGGTVAEAGPGETRVSVRLAANALVAGRVVSDASGVAVAASGLTVGLIDTGGWRSLSLRSPVTDADGSFLAPAVPAGRYRIEVRGLSADQYVRSVTWDGRDILKDGLELAGRPVSDLEIMLSTGAGTITGVVLDAAGEPAPLAAVVFVPSGEEAYLYREVRAGSDGDFAFEGLTPGDYTLYAWRELDGGAYRNEEFMRPYRALGFPVRIEAEAGEQRIRVRLAGEGSVQK